MTSIKPYTSSEAQTPDKNDEVNTVSTIKVPYFILNGKIISNKEDEVMIEEKVPIELCTRKRVNEESFFLERGKTFRKEGEKRRKKIGQRGKQEDKDKKEEQAEEL